MVILFRLLMTGYAVFLLHAAWKVLTGGVFRDDKVFFVGLNIVVIVAVVVIAWRNGSQERKNRKQPHVSNDAHEEAERRTYAGSSLL